MDAVDLHTTHFLPNAQTSAYARNYPSADLLGSFAPPTPHPTPSRSNVLRRLGVQHALLFIAPHPAVVCSVQAYVQNASGLAVAAGARGVRLLGSGRQLPPQLTVGRRPPWGGGGVLGGAMGGGGPGGGIQEGGWGGG